MTENTKSSSSAEGQRDIRIEKISKLQAKNHNPFSPTSKRDFNLGFVKFWFNFVHSLEHQVLLDEVTTNLKNSGLDYFVSLPIFATNLLHFDPNVDFDSEDVDEELLEQIEKILGEPEKGLFPDSEYINKAKIQNYLDEYYQIALEKHFENLPDIAEVELEEDLDDLEDDEDEVLVEMGIDEQLPFVKNETVTLAGRIKSKRVSGQIAFASMEDESCPEGFQFIFKKDILDGKEVIDVHVVEDKDKTKLESRAKSELSFEDFKELIDEGDFIQAIGYLDYSKSGEPSLFVQDFKILTKSIRPLPTELSDIEQKYRQRYIDMRLHPEVREMFTMKSKFWQSTRDFMVQNGFLELHMPTMEETTGGAEASPFTTHHNALDQDFYLRISSELHQKRMIVGGFEKIFDIDKNFRNEGIDDEHLQEFVQMEFYWAYADCDDLIEYTEKMMKFVIQETFGTMLLEYKGKIIDWSKPWPRMPYYEFVKHFGGIDISTAKTVEDLQKIADENGIKYESTDGFGRLLDLVYKRTSRTKCIEPVWLIDHPVEISPLAKRKPENSALTQRMQLVAYGSELCNGFSELNDPLDQKVRFEEQQAQRDGGDDEAMMIDDDFVEALEIGMPPTAGFAYSERLFSVLLQKPIRETTPFPLMKSKKTEVGGKSKTTKVAHVIILDTPDVPNWTKMNAVAHLSASLAARIGTSLIHIDKTTTEDGISIPMNIQHAIMIKSAGETSQILELKKVAEKSGLEVSIFTEEMLSSSDDNKVKTKQESKKSEEIGWLGICIFGKKDIVESLTDGFELVK